MQWCVISQPFSLPIDYCYSQFILKGLTHFFNNKLLEVISI